MLGKAKAAVMVEPGRIEVSEFPRVVAYLLLTFVVLLNDIPINICAQQSGKVYIYSFPESPSSEILRYFNNKSDWEVIFYSLNDSSSSERLLKMVEIFKVLGMDVLPPELCLPCEMQHHTLNDIWMMYASPLIGVFRNERLTAITIGITDHETLDQALVVNAEYVKVFTRYDVYALSDEGVKVRLEVSFVGEEKSRKAEVNVLNLTSSIVLLALADSVNPCTFAVFTALLFISLYSFGEMRAAMTGFSFILAIFIGYYALGLGLFQILVAIPNISKALALVGLVMGFFQHHERFKTEIQISNSKIYQKVYRATDKQILCESRSLIRFGAYRNLHIATVQ